MPSNTNTNLSLCIIKKQKTKYRLGKKFNFLNLFIVFFVKQLVSASLLLANKGREDWYVVIVKHGRGFQVWKTKLLICRPPDDSKCVCKKIVSVLNSGDICFSELVDSATHFSSNYVWHTYYVSKWWIICSMLVGLWFCDWQPGCCSKCAVLHTDLPLLVTFHVKTLRWQLWKCSCWGLKCLKGRFTSEWGDQNWQFVFLHIIFSVSLCSSKQIFRH